MPRVHARLLEEGTITREPQTTVMIVCVITYGILCGFFYRFHFSLGVRYRVHYHTSVGKLIGNRPDV